MASAVYSEPPRESPFFPSRLDINMNVFAGNRWFDSVAHLVA